MLFMLISIEMFCNGYFTHAWFCGTVDWPIEKHWFTEWCRSCKCWRFINLEKSLLYTYRIYKKDLRYWEALNQAHSGRYKFSKILISFKKESHFVIDNNFCQFIEITASCWSFLRECQKTSLNNQRLSSFK